MEIWGMTFPHLAALISPPLAQILLLLSMVNSRELSFCAWTGETSLIWPFFFLRFSFCFSKFCLGMPALLLASSIAATSKQQTQNFRQPEKHSSVKYKTDTCVLATLEAVFFFFFYQKPPLLFLQLQRPWCLLFEFRLSTPVTLMQRKVINDWGFLPTYFHSSTWWQDYLRWLMLVVSPPWCRTGMDAESALCVRQARHKIEHVSQYLQQSICLKEKCMHILKLHADKPHY